MTPDLDSLALDLRDWVRALDPDALSQQERLEAIRLLTRVEARAAASRARILEAHPELASG